MQEVSPRDNALIPDNGPRAEHLLWIGLTACQAQHFQRRLVMNRSPILRIVATTASAFALISLTGLASAQGTPPNTTSPNPATAAGQQTQTGTPMGTTGTLTQGTQAPAASPPAASTMPSTPMAADTSTRGTGTERVARADRN